MIPGLVELGSWCLAFKGQRLVAQYHFLNCDYERSLRWSWESDKRSKTERRILLRSDCYIIIHYQLNQKSCFQIAACLGEKLWVGTIKFHSFLLFCALILSESVILDRDTMIEYAHFTECGEHLSWTWPALWWRCFRSRIVVISLFLSEMVGMAGICTGKFKNSDFTSINMWYSTHRSRCTAVLRCWRESWTGFEGHTHRILSNQDTLKGGKLKWLCVWVWKRNDQIHEYFLLST